VSSAPGFNELLRTMAEQDFFTGIFPFLLTYVLVYLALAKVPLFTEEDGDETVTQDRFRALVSVIFAFFVSYFMVTNPVYQSFFTTYLSTVVIGVVGILGLLVLLALIPGFDMDYVGARIMVALIAIAAILAFTGAGGFEIFVPETDTGAISPALEYVVESGLIYIIIIGAALLWVTGSKDKDKKEKRRKYWFGPGGWKD